MESAEKEQSKITVPSSQASQQLPTNSQSAQSEMLPMFHTPLAVSWGQDWFSADRNLSQTGMPVPVPVILGSPQFFSMVNPVHIKQPYRSLTPLPTSVGVDQLTMPSRQISGVQSSINIRPSVPAKPASQASLSVNRRPTQAITPSKFQRVMPMNTASSLPSTNKRPAQLVSPKVQSESYGSVRSKLRESLAASLAMVSEPPIKQQIAEKSTSGDAPNGVTEVTTLVEETTEDNSFLDKSMPVNLISDGSAPMFEVQSEAVDASMKNATQSTVLIKSDLEEHQPKVVLSQEVGENNNSFVKDELLQGHGLCWASEMNIDVDYNSLHHGQKRLKMKNEPETANNETTAQKAENLAFRIESELFKLFAGVNKKYKEKGRSLLFNLKDRNNPELRERVLSGAITPERLCSMTIEELASKELSQWRLAKAEELAQMVVLPDDVDLRRLVKKTHKGEFQVEVEQVESFPVDAELGRSVPSKVPSKPSEVKTRKHSTPKTDALKASGSRSIARKDDSDSQNIHTDLEILGEKTDLMQELMVDEVKDPDSLPPIVSLDEFMQALDSEPPFENMSVDSLQEVPSSGIENLDCLESEKVPASGTMDAASDSLKTKSETSEAGSSVKHSSSQDTTQVDLVSSSATVNNPAKVNPEEIDKMCSVNDENLNPDADDIQSKSCPPEVALASDKIWEGSIQLNISSVATVIGFYRSGEKTSMQEWPSFFEIKGRVRLDAFEKFLKELPLSRTRAIMIVQFSWKEGSSESGRLSLIEISDSYATDNRVGFAEPAPGVEMYLCPPHSRMTDMVEKSLPKEQGGTLAIVADGLIGVVVWKRPHAAVSPRVSSHHKHGSSRKHLSTRKQQGDSSYTLSKSSLAQPSGSIQAATTTLPLADDESDVPPGFGPRDDDDLPEFDFAHGNSQSSKPVSSTGRPLAVAPVRPVEQIRQLIYKYGQSEHVKNSPIDVQPWNDNDEDDIPEWRPQNAHHHQQALPPSVPTPPQHPSQLHAYQQQPLQALQVNQQMLPLHTHIPLQQQQQQLLPLQMAALPTMATQQPFPQFAMMANPLNMMPRWQQPPMLSLGGVPVANMMQTPQFGTQANADVQMPNFGAVQNVMGWRPDVYGSRGA
ncbi:uncharacterized protein LOC121982193 [Zingiber officinale]|uniref:TFIIS central domain-containing protein n=1 Tax=Zingiber officinale TaxID=94328 RepID=A0A8J5GRZ3_ZINOF|nr:uncharacterized protein LOC121982193 [Zingiber officinale]KAG6508860.1 hypothetical protein ZIOFF_034242 [Zingiber officinale]